MKLKELAEIFKGYDFSKGIKEKKPHGKVVYYPYWTSNTLAGQEKKMMYISAKEIRKNGLNPKQIKLEYGDYILYKALSGEVNLYRFSSTEDIIPAGDLYIIRSNQSIVHNFLGYQKNKNHLYVEFTRKSDSNPELDWINILEEIDIPTDNILELEEANKQEEYAIRKPLTKDELQAIKITQKPITLSNLLTRIKYKELLLDTEFQRRPNLWNISIKSRFIETLIAKLPVPAFYFDGANDNEWLVIDGLQRLSTVEQFVNDKFALQDLDFLVELEGKRFSDLERAHQRNINEYDVFAYILDKGNPQNVKYKIFKNINSGQLALESQEIRHAISPGAPAKLLKTITESKWFEDHVPISDTLKSRMYDREVALRYIAFQRTHYKKYSPSIVDFLDNAMTDIYNIPAIQQEQYKKELKDTLALITEIFGEPCFSRSFFEKEKSTYIHNNIIFELLTCGLNTINEQQKQSILRNKNSIKKQLENFFIKLSRQNNRFWNYDYAYSKGGLQKRFEAFDKIMKSIKKEKIILNDK